MNYEKIYQSLVKSRQELRESKKTVGYELHHILPKSLGGSNDIDNLVLLTYREHYMAHLLLTKMYPNEAKIHYAFLCMLRDPHGERKLTSRMVDTIKSNYSEFKRWHSKVVNPMYSLSAKKKISERMKKNNPNKGGSSNHTAYPVEIIFDSGEVQRFEYLKQVTETLNVPYSSLKYANRNGLGLKKYKIKQVRKI